MESVEESELCPVCGRDKAQPHITPREADVLNLLAAGFDGKNLADRLGITVRTVKAHVGNLITKFQLNPRARHSRIVLAVAWSNPLFRIGAGYKEPISLPVFAADVIECDRVRAQEDRRGIAVAAD